jgi:hypothetical protein
MVWDGEFQEIEPEERELGEDLALVGYSATQNMVEGGDAIAGHEEELIVGQSVDVADLAAACEGEIAKIGLEKGCWHHVGTTSKSRRLVEWRSVHTENSIFASCLLRRRKRATGNDGFGLRARQGKSREGIAILRAESLACDLAAEKGSEGGDVVDVDINARIAGSVVTPGHGFVEQVIAYRSERDRVRLQDKGEREQNAGRKKGNQENNCAQGGEPFWGETGEQEDKKLIACNGEPVDSGVDVGGGGAPFCRYENKVKKYHGDGSAKKECP